MKRVVILLLLLSALGATAQNITVKSFKPLPDDNTATTAEGKRIDQNGDVAALIKMVTDESGLNFEGGALGIVDAKHLQGEVWVWVPRSARKITVKHPKLGVLRDYRYPVEIKAGQTYEMVLEFEKVIEEEELTEQFVSFNVTPPTAVLEVNDQKWQLSVSGNVSRLVEFGTYTYRVSAEGYHPDAGKVTVDDPKKPSIVTVNLRPNFSNVTLEVDADAEIWVDGEQKGTRTWTGPILAGTHQIECRQTHHEPSTTQKAITDQMDGEVIRLTPPRPITGMLKVESKPDKATVSIDGKAVGVTPLNINDILVGKHTLWVVKEGYTDFVDTIVIQKGELTKTHSTLNKQNYPTGAINGVFSVNENKKVYFSKGDLQYNTSLGTWRFAENQWDYIEGNYNNKTGNESSFIGWIGRFCWGTSGWDNGNTFFHPWDVDDIGSLFGPPGDYDLTGTYANADWGIYNPISNGGYQPGLWRTLTKEEWAYVFDKRSTASGICYAKAQVNNVNGTILLPDNWNVDFYNLNNTNDKKASFNANIISAKEWNVLEQHGAVFLPGEAYWSASSYENDYWAYRVGLWEHYLYFCEGYYRSVMVLVRLVADGEN